MESVESVWIIGHHTGRKKSRGLVRADIVLVDYGFELIFFQSVRLFEAFRYKIDRCLISTICVYDSKYIIIYLRYRNIEMLINLFKKRFRRIDLEY